MKKKLSHFKDRQKLFAVKKVKKENKEIVQEFLTFFVTEAMLKNIKTGSTIEAMSIPLKYVSYIRW